MTTQIAGVNAEIDELIAGPQHTLSFAEKEARLVPLFRKQFEYNAAHCPGFDRFLSGYGFRVAEAQHLAQFPPLPVSIFKRAKLTTCADGEIVRVLQSSGTTQQVPSRIYLDKRTLHRQGRALLSVLRTRLGSTRRPYLVLDVPEVNDRTKATLSIRGAAIRGIAALASETTYALTLENGEPVVDLDALTSFCSKYADQPVVISGFTFLIWASVLPALEKAGLELGLRDAFVLHSGGWKRLTAERVSKEVFSERVSKVFGCRLDRVLDFYGMVEQVGTIFIDCEMGHKHPPAFSAVLIREPLTMDVAGVGGEGLIEIMSVLPSSYPGQALLTEDMGRLMAVDTCPCGRKDVAFRFTSRVEGAEVRGCGDTLARPRPGLPQTTLS